MKTIAFLVLFGSFVVFLAALLVLKFSKKEWIKKACIIVTCICTTFFIFFLLLCASLFYRDSEKRVSTTFYGVEFRD
jgi:hypothetical protein